MTAIEGLGALVSRLSAYADALAPAAAEALPGAAEAIAGAVRARVPVETGALRDSVSASAEGDTARVRATAPHAAYVELGTFRAAPRPFLAPAYAAEREKVIAAVAEAIARIE